MKHFMQENKSTFGHKPIPQKGLRRHYNKDNGKEIHNEEETVSLSVPSLEKIQSSSLVMCDCCEYFVFLSLFTTAPMEITKLDDVNNLSKQKNGYMLNLLQQKCIFSCPRANTKQCLFFDEH